MGENKSAIDLQDYYTRCIDIVQRVIKTPAAFYREMPKFGGLVEPLIFMVAMGVLAGLIHAVLGIVGIGMAKSFLMALASIILVRVYRCGGSFSYLEIDGFSRTVRSSFQVPRIRNRHSPHNLGP